MAYEKAYIAVDPVIFTIQNNRLKVMLKKREKEPFKSRYELSGGLILANETAEETLTRKLKELLGTSSIYFDQFETFTAPKRDPRERAVTIGFIALVNDSLRKEQQVWYDVNKLPQLAFDHEQIIARALTHLQRNLNSLVAKQLMPETFPLNDLQNIYEIIQGNKHDNRNFRKKMLTDGIVKETKLLEKNVSHRPAKLYKFK